MNAVRLRDGLALHEAGKIADAMAVYRGVLAAEPRQFDAPVTWRPPLPRWPNAPAPASGLRALP